MAHRVGAQEFLLLGDKQDKIMGTKELSSFISYDSTISDANHLNAF